MATIANITTVAYATSGTHSYVYATYQVTNQGQVNNVVSLTKYLSPPGAGTKQEWGGYGAHPSLTTAKALALASLNAARLHRYAGAPGNATGATVATTQHGDTNTVDTT